MNQKKNKFLVFSRNKLTILAPVLVALFVALLALFLFQSKSYQMTNETESPESRPLKVPRLIDGPLVDEKNKNPQLAAVMIDNFVESWPSYGLSQAALVYEAPCEAAIPRFMTIFTPDKEVAQIGPVRSARPYYLEWAKELQALYAHVGGSNAALEEIKNGGIYDLNQYYDDQVYFWRSKNRPAPHNVFTSSERLAQAMENKNLTQSNFEPWLFKDDISLDSRGNMDALIIPHIYEYPEYEIKWQYNRENNEYLRFQGGKKHVDANNDSQITAKNVIVQFAKMKILDKIGRRQIDLVGQGRALIIIDGHVKNGVWKKPSSDARTKFYYQDGQEIELNRGRTWTHVMPIDAVVNYK